MKWLLLILPGIGIATIATTTTSCNSNWTYEIKETGKTQAFMNNYTLHQYIIKYPHKIEKVLNSTDGYVFNSHWYYSHNYYNQNGFSVNDKELTFWNIPNKTDARGYSWSQLISVKLSDNTEVNIKAQGTNIIELYY